MTTNGVDRAAAAKMSGGGKGQKGQDHSHSGIERLRELEALFLGGPVNAVNEVKCFSTETLLDVLLVLFNECNNSSLRKEKTVTDFIEIVKPVANRVKNLRLCKDDFEILKVIGRGAFGEVRNCPVRIPFDYEIILLGKYPSQIPVKPIDWTSVS